jgi:hypothetical protein
MNLKDIFLYTDRSEYKLLTPALVRYIDNLIFKSWWVILFILFCAIAYEWSIYKIDGIYEKLDRHAEELDLQRKSLIHLQEDLKLQVNSQSDPAWIELTLIKELGLVPEGYSKVFFRDIFEPKK